MKKLFLIIAFISIGANAQEFLKFDKKNYQCVDKWVTFGVTKDSTYSLARIYLDRSSRLTVGYFGAFTIDKMQHFAKVEKYIYEDGGTMIERVEPSRQLIAEIPATKFKELELHKVPKFLLGLDDGDSSEFLYKRGFRYNEWNEFETALTYLLRADKIEPTYKLLQTEIGFTYNALGNFDKAVFALLKAIRQDPNDCYAKKELAYAYIHLDKFDKATQTYNAMVKNCNAPSFLLETAYNLAVTFSVKKDKVVQIENRIFDKWKAETLKQSKEENQYTKNLDALEKEFGTTVE